MNDFNCTIEWPSEKNLRARKVVKRSNTRVTYKFPSIKMGRMMQCESSLELAACLLHDIDPFVNRFYEQPARLTFQLNNENRVHYPDLYVETQHGGIFREIKENKEMSDHYLMQRKEYLSVVLPLQGYMYEMLWESEIRREPRLTNSQFIHQYGRCPVSFMDLENIRRIFNKYGQVVWGDILNNRFEDMSIYTACRLLIDGVLVIDFDSVWEEGTPISLVSMM